MAWSLRGRLFLGSLVVALAACGPGVEPQSPTASFKCRGAKRVSCERDLAQAAASGEVRASLVVEYILARAAEDASDPWAKVWGELSGRRGATAAIVDARGGSKIEDIPETKAIAIARLPEPEGVTGLDLLLAMGIVAGYDHVVWLGAGDGKASYEIYPRDPLAPLMLGMRAAIRDDAAAASLAKDVAIAATVRRALDAAGAFRYVDAAREHAALGALVEGRDAFEEPVMRARYVRGLLAGAGLTLDAPSSIFTTDPAEAKAAKVPPVPAPSDADSPYGDLLRVRLADDTSAEWKRRSGRILPAIPEDRRALAEAYYAPPSACNAVLAPPAFDRIADVTFASLLSPALAGARVQAIASPPAPNEMPLPAWYPRYEALVDVVDRARFVWFDIGVLLRQRGEIQGISPRATPAYKRVTDLGLKHLAALSELAASDPVRYTGHAELGLAYSGGLLADEKLRDALVRLTESTTKSKLGRAAEPESIAATLLIAVFTGMTYPPAIQEVHYAALQSAFAAKVKGELSKKTGWGTAGLLALDALVRIVWNQGPNLEASSNEIVRALSDPSLPLPNVAAVVSAIVRYAALAKDRPLAALAKPAQFTPERAAAREALRKAILGMGDGGAASDAAPAQLADDLTTLADGLIAAASVLFHKKPAPPGTCADTAPSAADIEISHALTNLGLLRQKILQSPRFKSGDGLWTKRARLLVALLSDAMDFIAPTKSGATRKLLLSAAELDQALTGALADWDEPGARDAIVGAYSLARFLFARDPKSGVEGGGPFLFRALAGIGQFLRGGASDGGATLLDAIAGAPAGQGRDDLLSALVAFAKAAYDRGQPDQGDVLLLGTLLLTSSGRTPPPKEALALAAEHQSRIAWALSLFSEVAAANATGKPNLAAVAPALRKTVEAHCAVARPDDMIAALGAIADYAAGKRKEARTALTQMLARADADGLVVPKLAYQYVEKHDKKMFSLSFGLTYGAGLLEGGNTFQIGLGFSTIADRSTKLTVSAASPEETAPETARYYVRAAALAAAYDFLDGDPASGAVNARRALSAIVSGVRLGARSMTSDRARWAEDARALLAVDAALAADAGLPFLAGDLWTIVKDALPKDADDAKIAEILSPAPFGLAGLKDAEPAIERAKRSLRVVAAPLACTTEKVETLSYAQPACADYPLALALRVADVVDKLPQLKRSKGSADERCASLASLDAFLQSAARGAYDPDAFTKAVESLLADGRADEASTLLARQRKDGHCSPAILKTARSLGRSAALLPASRADMLAVAVNCAGADGGADLEKDLLAIDEETRKLADPMRNLKLLLFVAQLAARSDKPALLLPLVRTEGFVDRFLRLSANAATGALVLHHAAFALNEQALDLPSTQGAFSLVCESFRTDDRLSECDDLKALRDASKPAAARKDLAKAAIERLLAHLAAPPPDPKKKP